VIAIVDAIQLPFFLDVFLGEFPFGKSAEVHWFTARFYQHVTIFQELWHAQKRAVNLEASQ